MSSALSSELRGRFRAYIEEGLSGRAAAARLKLSEVVAEIRASR